METTKTAKNPCRQKEHVNSSYHCEWSLLGVGLSTPAPTASRRCPAVAVVALSLTGGQGTSAVNQRDICVRSLLCPASSYPSIPAPSEQIIKGHYHLEMVVMQESSRQITIMCIFLRLCPSHQELLTTVTIKPKQTKHTHTHKPPVTSKVATRLWS